METSQTMPAREMERMMKLQDVILKAMAKKITWIAAAEIAGMSVRNMQRKRQAYQEHDYTGLFDQRRGKRSIHRVPMETAEKVLALYQQKYFDFSVRHFHEKLKENHEVRLSYSWVKQALQGAGLVARRKKRGSHRRRRLRRPLPGMMLHMDGSKHRWFQDDRYYDLIVILDDATSEIYYAQLVEEESTRTAMAALREAGDRACDAGLCNDFLSSREAFEVFMRRIETTGVSKAEFTHAAHLAVGAYCAVMYGERAFERTKAAILRQNAAAGTENTATSGYHETLTRFWSDVLRRETASIPDAYEAAKRAVAKYGEDRELPMRCYSFDVVASGEARTSWISPDVGEYRNGPKQKET